MRHSMTWFTYVILNQTGAGSNCFRGRNPSVTVELFHHRIFCSPFVRSGLAPACCTCCWQSLPRKSWIIIRFFFASTSTHEMIKSQKSLPLGKELKGYERCWHALAVPLRCEIDVDGLDSWGPHSIAASPRLSPACEHQKQSNLSMEKYVTVAANHDNKKFKNVSMPECAVS